ncbi:MAG: bifunctional glycosyltransferase/class I SAM-dependent methyltransferase [Polyangiaceae bacterium]
MTSAPLDISDLQPPASTTHVVPKKRIAIFIVTYNAASTLRQVLDRIPESVWDKVEEVFVFDDESKDDTFLVGMGYKAHHGKAKLSVFRNEKNQGYGGNQIRGYQYAIERGYDIVALLHGDGQYAPEALPQLLAPLERGEADAVFGSRMMVKSDALKGGMPLYKFVGNQVLTTFENAMLGTNLSEFHSGYRIYSVDALKRLPFDRNTHDFHFDTQIIIQMHAAGMRIVETPIPTYYGDEICYVNGMRYAKDVTRSVFEYQLHTLGISHRPEYEVQPNYTVKRSKLASHAQILSMVGPEARRVLDVGCGQGELGRKLMERGHHVVGIDAYPPKVKLDEFIRADLAHGLPLDRATDPFDVIVLADVLEHMAEPRQLIDDALGWLRPGGKLLVSLPNAVHWSVRAQVLWGRFDYANKGILDRGHLRFLTQASARRLFEEAGLVVGEHRIAPIPWENVLPAAAGSIALGAVEKLDYFLGRVRPNLFAYQHLFELRRADDTPASVAALSGPSA